MASTTDQDKLPLEEITSSINEKKRPRSPDSEDSKTPIPTEEEREAAEKERDAKRIATLADVDLVRRIHLISFCDEAKATQVLRGLQINEPKMAEKCLFTHTMYGENRTKYVQDGCLYDATIVLALPDWHRDKVMDEILVPGLKADDTTIYRENDTRHPVVFLSLCYASTFPRLYQDLVDHKGKYYIFLYGVDAHCPPNVSVLNYQCKDSTPLKYLLCHSLGLKYPFGGPAE